VQLTELLYQRVKQLGAQGQFALRPGYTAVVSNASVLRSVLVAPLFPASDDVRRLVDGEGPTRIGLGIVAIDGTPYRILREIGGDRQLQKLDPASNKFATVSDDNLEIDSFLRVECGLPPGDHYNGFFVLDRSELPSARAQPSSSARAAVDHARVAALKEELESTSRFEAVQDQLFRVQQRLLELSDVDRELKGAEQELAVIERELGPTPWTAEQMKDLSARASRAKSELKKRDDALSDVATRRQNASHALAAPAGSLMSNPWFVLGILGGFAVDGAAAFFKKPILAFAGLLPFTAALIAALHWVHADETDKDAAAYLKELKDREESIKRAFNEEYAPLRNAMRSMKVDSASDLLELFSGREDMVKKRDDAKKRLEQLRKKPDLSRVAAEISQLQSEKAQLEAQVASQGFARTVAEIELELKQAMGLGDAPRGDVLVPDPEVPGHLVDRASDLMSTAPEQTWESIAEHVAAHLAALTDGALVSGMPDEKGSWIVTGEDGSTTPYQGLPPTLKDLAYAALRLALVEAVAPYKRLPIVVDDAFSALDADKRKAIAKVLKGIAAQTQVIHRTAEAPPDGIADHVVQA
jgi:hypothetical protein